jgi:virginiamycin B lyase
MRRTIFLGAAGSLALLAGIAIVAPGVGSEAVAAEGDELAEVDLMEWEVPWENTRPRDPFAVSETEVWFVGQGGHYAARLNPETEIFDRVDLPEGAGPHNQIVAPDGAVWYAGNLVGHIGRIDPVTLAIEQIPMPDPAVRDPHTLIFDEAGDIWFSAQFSNYIGKLTLATREVELIKVPTERSRPYGIKIAPDGKIWVVLFGTNKLAMVDPDTMALTEIAIPRETARPRRVEITSDGRIWYGDYADGFLGAYDPANGTFEEWALPSGAASRPYGMAMDSQDRIWVVETGVQPNRFIGFDPATETYFAGSDVPSGGRTIRHMHYHEPTNTIWFGADTNTVGRAKLD